ncbi:helix-turn-helix domain-containing protein [uncultured Methylobacterium sp.]|uniref:helix-turn-helix domain-containing protein n=1 Tax=uncultured Methylobacterium sp. TaxID=157278 RepID=UPI0034440848
MRRGATSTSTSPTRISAPRRSWPPSACRARCSTARSRTAAGSTPISAIAGSRRSTPCCCCRPSGAASASSPRPSASRARIRHRRLQAVHALLLLPTERRSIGELAQTFGFSRPSHLATAFRRAYGYSPRHLRASRSPRRGEPDPTPPDRRGREAGHGERRRDER